MTTTPEADAGAPMPSLERRELVKLLALALMVVDHVGRVFFPDVDALRAIGRPCFPLIAALLAAGFLRTSNVRRYALRIFALAVVSQVPFGLAFGASWSNMFFAPIVFLRAPSLLPIMSLLPFTLPELNVLFTLLVALLALWLLRARRFVWLVPVAIAAFILPIEYGLYGVTTVALFYLYFTGAIGRWPLAALLAAASVFVACMSGFETQSLASLAVVPVAFLPARVRIRWRMPWWAYYAFYPVHLLGLWAATRAL